MFIIAFNYYILKNGKYYYETNTDSIDRIARDHNFF